MSPLQKLASLIGPARFLRLMRVYPPYLGAGVRVTRAEPDLSRVDVELRLTRWNRNYVGTHFGGSLYSMCDPFFMLMLMTRLGPGYVVWDKSASIEFLRPGAARSLPGSSSPTRASRRSAGRPTTPRRCTPASR